MHQQLSKAPVTYVLAQVKFSSIENIASYIPQLQDEIRDLFPHYNILSIQAIELKNAQQPPDFTVLTQWHFIDKEKQMGIILDKQAIILHTNKHEKFQTLLSIFETIIARFNKVLKISLSTRLGIRYINLIEHGLQKVNIGLRGFQLLNNGFKEDQFITNTETTQFSQEGIIKIKSTLVKNKTVIGNTFNIFVPLDLVDTAKSLSFQHLTEPKNGFLMLDIDHFSDEQDDFDMANILNRFRQLQEGVYQAFCQSVEKENLKDWM